MAFPIRLSANISMLFVEHAFPDRIAAAAAAGFRAVECQFPYDYDAHEIAARVSDNGLVLNHINTPVGANGEAGFAAIPGAEDRFRAGLERALEYARIVGAQTIHCMSGTPPEGVRAKARDCFLNNMRRACNLARNSGATLVIEPLNARDRPGYFVSRSDEVVELLKELDCDNIKLLFDLYHIQIMEGDLIGRLERHWPFIGHVQLASVPGRREPSEGEIAYRAVCEKLVTMGWKGFVGAEYNPRGETLEGLDWARPWLAT